MFFLPKGTAAIVTVVSSVLDSTLCQTLEWNFVGFVVFPSWQNGALTLGCRALQHHLDDKCNPYEKLWQYTNPRMHHFRFCFRL